HDTLIHTGSTPPQPYTPSLHDALPISLGDEGPQEILEEPGRAGIEPHHGLVHHDELGLMDQGGADQDLLTHAVRVALDQLVLPRSEEHTSELQSRENLVCRLLLEKKNQ